MPPSTRRRQAPPPSSRRQTRVAKKEAEELDLRPVGADGSRPPRLELYILTRLKILLVANILPFIAMGVLAYMLIAGKLQIKGIMESRLWASVLLILVSLVAIGIAGWVLLPLARWTRACPRWYFRHDSKAIWFLPLAGGFAFTAVIWLVCAALCSAAIFVISTGIWDLISRGFGGEGGA